MSNFKLKLLPVVGMAFAAISMSSPAASAIGSSGNSTSDANAIVVAQGNQPGGSNRPGGPGAGGRGDGGGPAMGGRGPGGGNEGGRGSMTRGGNGPGVLLAFVRLRHFA